MPEDSTISELPPTDITCKIAIEFNPTSGSGTAPRLAALTLRHYADAIDAATDAVEAMLSGSPPAP